MKEKEFIEEWFGSKIPEDWDIEYQPLRNVSVSQMGSMLKSFAQQEVNNALQEISDECKSVLEVKVKNDFDKGIDSALNMVLSRIDLIKDNQKQER